MKSKFLGLEFNGWKVVEVIKAGKVHRRFYLTKEFKENNIQFTLTMTLLDNAMTQLSRGKSIDAFLKNKLTQVYKFKTNIYRNQVFMSKRGE